MYRAAEGLRGCRGLASAGRYYDTKWKSEVNRRMKCGVSKQILLCNPNGGVRCPDLGTMLTLHIFMSCIY
jgi:hypothetical protein